MLPVGWGTNVRVCVGADGYITEVIENTKPQPSDINLGPHPLLPAMSNVHSHGFQRLLAGRTGLRTSGKDDFWSWRELMYRLANSLTPDELEDITVSVYKEMLSAGFAAVGEFHYLHHQPDGQPYDNLAELSNRVLAAAKRTGIGLTFLPVLYSYGGIRGAPLMPEQRRFGNSLDQFSSLVEAIKPGIGELPSDTRLGVAAHSLRATLPEQLTSLRELLPNGPIHIHAAEQTQEVNQVKQWLGARPVEFLFDHCGIDRRWCIIHATHMNDMETTRLAQSGTVAGVCPITEADLGDGIFRAAEFRIEGGSLGIGTDSNVQVAVTKELRQLEYSQRLVHHRRNMLAEAGHTVGQGLYRSALQGGARALARPTGSIERQHFADLLTLSPAENNSEEDYPQNLLDHWIFNEGSYAIRDVWVAGRHVITVERPTCHRHQTKSKRSK